MQIRYHGLSFKVFKLLLAVLIAYGFSPALAAQNIVINGDFSSGFSPWVSGGGGGDWAAPGSRAELGNVGSERLDSADFSSPLVDGVEYEVSFTYGFIVDSDPTPNNALGVRVRDGTGGPVTGTGLGTNGVLSFSLDNFTGSGTARVFFTPDADFTSAFLRFTGQNANGNGAAAVLYVDDVVVRRRVPELDGQAGALPLTTIACLLALVRDRRRRS